MFPENAATTVAAKPHILAFHWLTGYHVENGGSLSDEGLPTGAFEVLWRAQKVADFLNGMIRSRKWALDESEKEDDAGLETDESAHAWAIDNEMFWTGLAGAAIKLIELQKGVVLK